MKRRAICGMAAMGRLSNPWVRAVKLLALVGLMTSSPAFADDDLRTAQLKLTLSMTHDELGGACRRIDTVDASQLAPVSLHRTFHDDFDVHPLKSGHWVPHYAGGSSWPDAQYWGGQGSQLKRQTKPNGEQQIYVDPRYAGLAQQPLGLDPFRVHDGILSIVASRTPPELLPVL